MSVIKKYFSAIRPLTALLFITFCSFSADTLAAASKFDINDGVSAAIAPYILPFKIGLSALIASLIWLARDQIPLLKFGSMLISGFFILIIWISF